jgi:uncharacterized protein
MKIAVVGSGISGMAAAWSLASWADVTVFESENRLGGHTHTQHFELEGIRFPVDTGFIVFNHRTYPGLKKWFELLGVETAPSDMSFSACLNQGELEWCGTTLGAVFAQKKNLVSPRFWKMLADILRFNKEAPQHADAFRMRGDDGPSLGEYLDQHRYGELFLNAYLLPMAGAIWSCPTEQMRAFPMLTFTRFCENHGLLQVANRPQWFTVRGGSENYIQKLKSNLLAQGDRVSWRLGHQVEQVLPVAGGTAPEDGGPATRVQISGRDLGAIEGARHFSETFDAVIMACHSDQSAAMLKGSQLKAGELASQIRYQNNSAVIHTDLSLMPRRRKAWASWNYLHDTHSNQHSRGVSVTYWMNQLQPLPVQTPVLVTLNATRPPDPNSILNEMHYSHPIFDGPAVSAQRLLPGAQGEGGVWLAGAWTRYGFHEDGFQSGLSAAQDLQNKLAPVTGRTDYARAA